MAGDRAESEKVARCDDNIIVQRPLLCLLFMSDDKCSPHQHHEHPPPPVVGRLLVLVFTTLGVCQAVSTSAKNTPGGGCEVPGRLLASDHHILVGVGFGSGCWS